MANIIFKNNML